MNTQQAIDSLTARITSMNNVPLDVVRVPVNEIAVLLAEIDRLKSKYIPLSSSKIEGLQEDYVFFGSCTEIVRTIEAELGIESK